MSDNKAVDELERSWASHEEMPRTPQSAVIAAWRRLLVHAVDTARAEGRKEGFEKAAARLSEVAHKYKRGSLSYALLEDAANIIRAMRDGEGA